MADIIYKNQNKSKKEFLRVMQFRPNLFIEGETAQETVEIFYKKQQIPWQPKKRLNFFLVLFYASYLEKGKKNTKNKFSKLIEANINSLHRNSEQAHKLLEKVKLIRN
jgi:hypothetical protein